jgi:hypothetical protein
VQDIEPVRDAGGQVVRYTPQGRYANAGSQPLHAHGDGAFCKFRVNTRAGEGVYAFVVGGNVMYVGECADLADRMNSGYGNISPKNCFHGGQKTNCRVNKLVLECVERRERVGLWFAPTTARKAAEERLIRALSPPWNVAGVRGEDGSPPSRGAERGLATVLCPQAAAVPRLSTELAHPVETVRMHGERERDRSTADKPVRLVWQVADEMYARNRAVSRTEIIEECVRRGVALNTARTQYSAWRLVKVR